MPSTKSVLLAHNLYETTRPLKLKFFKSSCDGKHIYKIQFDDEYVYKDMANAPGVGPRGHKSENGGQGGAKSIIRETQSILEIKNPNAGRLCEKKNDAI